MQEENDDQVTKSNEEGNKVQSKKVTKSVKRYMPHKKRKRINQIKRKRRCGS